ncbi:MAG: TolC family protein [Phycisphaerae bacterium]|nr:TolC family protein [Phycisphaerae bacterium]
MTIALAPATAQIRSEEPALDPAVEAMGREPSLPTTAMPVGDLVSTTGIEPRRIVWHLPDPEEFADVTEAMIAQYEADVRDGRRQESDVREARDYQVRLLELLRAVDRPRQIQVSRRDILHRTLANSYAIRVQSYTPAIDQTRIVEAEAAFDATFFATFNKTRQNVPVSTAIEGSNVDVVVMESGLRQLLPGGMQVQTSLNLQRQSNDFQFQTVNPVYESQFKVEFRQALLRGFGLDYNRTQILVAKNDMRISDQEFARQVQTTLLNVETAYWRLYQARRILGVQARMLATFELLYRKLEQRKEFDAIPVQINETRAQLESARADFIRICNEIRNAEDNLIALVNDPALDLADDAEIIPTDVPMLDPIVLDRLAEAQAALDRRQEIAQAKLRIHSARILVGAAKNQVMPKLDLLFQYAVDGLGINAHNAFSEVTKNDYHEYFVGVEFEIPVGNRARRAAERRAQLQQGQAIAALKSAFEQVLLDVNVRVREVITQQNLIQPNLHSADASEARLDSIRVRAETNDYLQISNELSAIRSLAVTRNDLLQSVVEYNIAMVELERSKGTLLDYYNVVIPVPEQHMADSTP